MDALELMTVISSIWPFTLALRTQKPVSSLRKETRFDGTGKSLGQYICLLRLIHNSKI
jgi:hypothetical protein